MSSLFQNFKGETPLKTNDLGVQGSGRSPAKLGIDQQPSHWSTAKLVGWEGKK
jgi:hypothetical protein